MVGVQAAGVDGDADCGCQFAGDAGFLDARVLVVVLWETVFERPMGRWETSVCSAQVEDNHETDLMSCSCRRHSELVPFISSPTYFLNRKRNQTQLYRTFSSCNVNPLPALARRLYLTVGHLTTGLNLSTGLGATAAALDRRAARRRDLRPGWSKCTRTRRCQSLWKWLLGSC